MAAVHLDLLRLFDVPMCLDCALEKYKWQLDRGPAPFEEALPSMVWAWLLRLIWGDDVGVVVLSSLGSDSQQGDLAPADNMDSASAKSNGDVEGSPSRSSSSGSMSSQPLCSSIANVASSAAMSAPSNPIVDSTGGNMPCIEIEGNPEWFGQAPNNFDGPSYTFPTFEVSCDASNASTAATPKKFDFDHDSDCDSLMPQKPRKVDEGATATMDLLSICLGSTALLVLEASASTASGGTWNF